MTNQIILYSPLNSNRLTYVLDFIFTQKGVNYRLIDNIDEFKILEGIKINYSNISIENSALQIPAEGLLFENHIRSACSLKHTKVKDYWLLNEIEDHLSVIFYMLTCYEEYNATNKDEHDRFPAKNSTLFKQNRLHKPNVDLIIKQLWVTLGLDYLKVQNKFKTTITFDIDSAWAIKNKSFIRQIAGDFKAVIKKQSLKARIQIRKNKKKDPFDTFDLIKQIAKKHTVICFFLLGDWSKFDKNINWKNKAFRSLIQDINKHTETGIHPSYKSYLNKNKVKKEIERLDFILGKKTMKSRQHFLKLSLPKTYETLVDLGIKQDYSMGFADAYGFRSGTSFSYFFFNLNNNTVSDLEIHPISYMDGTLNQYMKLDIEESIKIVLKLKAEIKNIGGHFIPLWHNETINNIGIWEGWIKVLENSCKFE